MGIEIERRFLVFNLPPLGGITPDAITQGYLSRDSGPTVRVRQVNLTAAFLTVKGPKVGASAPEFEYAIPTSDLPGLLALCKTRTLTKDRYGITGTDGSYWELDVFTGRHAGLVIAEIELPDEKTPFVKPSWLGPEITADGHFSNANLVTKDIADVRKWISKYQGNKGSPPRTP